MTWLLNKVRLIDIISLLIVLTTLVYNVNSAAVMSIDLGNEWMKVGVVSPGVPMEIALNKESKRKTPTILAFRDGIRTFGEDAQTIGIKFPSKAYGYLFDLLGKTVDNPVVDLYRKRFPYYEIIGDPERNTVVFKGENEEFKVEELIAQILQKAKEFAESSTGQPITECVLIVPGYFGQSERSAYLTAASLANLKVLQLVNDYTAVALNYGVFHRGEINETAQYFVFYDMGAQKTSAAVVSFQLVKDKQTRETNPVIQVLGVGYDRTLGGLEIQLRLRDHLAKEFNAMKKTKTDVFTNPRALAKLFKEAGRVKNVLSANNDHYAQIENLIEDHDFKIQVTREKLEELCEDIWPKVVGPLRQAIKISGMTLDVINQVILFGGGTRVPKIQEILKTEIKQELGKSLNSDEAATMGAVYKAADLATGFKVKKFILKDAVLFPIQVVFERTLDDGNQKEVRRTLFGHMNNYPQKKVITFNKNTKDFDFYANYADLGYLTEEEISYIGSLNLTSIALKKVSDLYEKNQGENVESKGIKAHFILDDSGIFELTGVDYVFEKVKGDADESTLSKLGSTITKLFSGGDNKNEEVKEEELDQKPKESEEAEKTEKENDKEEKVNATTNQTDEIKTNDTKPEDLSPKNDTVKVVTIKEPVDYEVVIKYSNPLKGENFENSFKKLETINKDEFDRVRKESAFNSLESHVIEVQDKLQQKEYSSCATDQEAENILKICLENSEWLYNGGEEATADVLEKRLNELKKLSNVIYARHWEHDERPEALKAMTGLIAHSQKFFKTIKNLTKDVTPEKDVFTEIELKKLEEVIFETENWQKDETKAQNKLKRSDDVRLTIKDITDRMATLDREVKYLVNKLKIWRPKKPVVKKEKKSESKDTNETKTEDKDDAKVENEDEEQVEEPIVEENETTSESTTEDNTEKTTTEKHAEL